MAIIRDSPERTGPPVLVTGAAGFIGSCVARRLAAEGIPVRAFLRATSRTGRIDGLPVERACGDVLDAESVRRAVAGCQAVIHLAGPSAWSQLDSPAVVPAVVDGTRNVLEASAANGVRRIVYVSSAAALGPSSVATPRDEQAVFDERAARGLVYVEAKRAAEQICRAFADRIEVVIASPAEVYGPDDCDLVTAGNLVALARWPALVCPGGTAIVHVDDAADGIVRALDRGVAGQRYLLAGENLHHHQLARLLLDLLGRRRRVLSIPRPVVRAAARAARALRTPFPIPLALVPYATSFWFCDSHKARTELGWQFRSARETLADTVEWLRRTGHLP